MPAESSSSQTGSRSGMLRATASVRPVAVAATALARVITCSRGPGGGAG